MPKKNYRYAVTRCAISMLAIRLERPCVTSWVVGENIPLVGHGFTAMAILE
jgi:hypothetical protein